LVEGRTTSRPTPAPDVAETPVGRFGASLPDEPRTREDAPSRTVTNRSVTGRVVDIQTPGRSEKVSKGDTLEKIARELDSDVAELAKLNKLKKPYRLQPGQTIRGPGGSARAYVVGSGDTLSNIAKRFDVSVDALRNANGLRRGASVAPGRKLRLPSGYRDRGPIVTTSEVPVAPPPVRTTPTTPPPVRLEPPVATPSRPQPYNPPRRVTPPRTYTPQGAVTGAPSASPSLSDSQIMEMGAGRFAWPLRGEIISSFGGRGTGPRNDGLNIRASAGAPVRAAASGDVVYAGDQVPGFGNLVLIKHPDGWVTAYGHLSRVDVRMQQKVSQGQQIGEAGSSGGVGEPQLHFEVRHAPTPQERARPVDPALVLPR
jgi:murein DD-endopeptidase MepM/ murein hydrolase activator NlpD